MNNILVLAWSENALLYADVYHNEVNARQRAMAHTEDTRIVEVVCYHVQRNDEFHKYNRLSKPEKG